MIKGSEFEFMFEGLLEKRGITCFEREYKFCEWKNSMFDFAFPSIMIAVEIDGGVWKQGRHNRPVGFMRDCEKLNIAGSLGWTVFRIPSPWFKRACFCKVEFVISHIVKKVAESDKGDVKF